ncbi:putative quinol monooxygenase [Bradyrhizobium niftali]|jgi:quinol monooxygenase YgiN|uniref:putative quinol monooxygenase n=1 Tax=Bradyrhizobium niftali TaxID=2560055 RepID=UPI001F3F9DBA|nr:putative quinol monooxygenase [Bradyrhizobium niftali]
MPEMAFALPIREEADLSISHLLLIGGSVLTAAVSGTAAAAEVRPLYVQEAEIEIDPAQLESYKAAVAEHIETATRVEPGIIALYAVSENDNPTRVRVFEIYRDQDAYRSHLETAHFKTYKATVEKMVRSLKLIRTTPIAFGALPR